MSNNRNEKEKYIETTKKECNINKRDLLINEGIDPDFIYGLNDIQIDKAFQVFLILKKRGILTKIFKWSKMSFFINGIFPKIQFHWNNFIHGRYTFDRLTFNTNEEDLFKFLREFIIEISVIFSP